MSGSWHIYRPGERWQQPRAFNMRIVIENSDYRPSAFAFPWRRCTPGATLARDQHILAPEIDVAQPGFRCR
jgi:endonuclease-8